MSLRNLLFFGAVAVLTTAGCTSSDGGAAHESATQTPTTETSTADAAAATADKQKTATESEEAGTTKTHNGKSHRHSRTPASNGKASAKNVYVVQIGAFKIKENAEKLRRCVKL
jgi:cell division protein FtsN